MDLYIGTILMWPIRYATTGTVSCNGQLLPFQQNQALYALLGTTYGGNGTSTIGVPNLINRVPYGSTDLGGGVTNGGPPTPAGTFGPYATTATVRGTAVGTLAPANLPGHTHPASFAPATGTVPVTVSAPTAAIPVTIPVAASAPSSSPSNPLTGNVYLTNATSSAGGNLRGPYQTAQAPSVGILGATASGNPGGTFTGTVNTVTGGTVTVQTNNTGTPTAFAAPLDNGAITGQLPRPPFLAINFIIATVGIWPDNPN